MSISNVIDNFTNMEEVKREGAKEEMCACHSGGMTCSGSTHRYCFKRCCMLRCFAAIAVLGLVFAAGVCAGGGDRHHGYGEYGWHNGYRGQMMMREGFAQPMMGGQNYEYVTPQGGRVIMMQRAIGTSPTAVSATTSTTK